LRVGDEHLRRADRNALLAQRDEIRQLPANVSNTGAAVSICISTDGTASTLPA